MPKTYNTIPTVSTGDVYTATAHNAIGTTINSMRVPPSCKARRTSVQTIANASATAIQFDASDSFDTDTMHDTVTSNTRITVNTSGIYIVTGQIYFATSATGSYRVISIAKNGTELASANFGAGTDKRCTLTYIDAAANATDYYELLAYQDSGGNLNTQTVHGVTSELSATWLGQVS
jgi:hypothetical protein